MIFRQLLRLIVTILIVTIPAMILEAAAASKISRYHQQSGECIYMQNMPTHRLMHILHMLCMFIAYFFCILSIFFACFFPYNLHICYVEVYVMAYFMHILCIYLHIYCIFIAYLYILYAYFCILNAFFVHI